MSATQSAAAQASPEAAADELEEGEPIDEDGSVAALEEEPSDGRDGASPEADDGKTEEAPNELCAGPEKTGATKDRPSAAPLSR